MFAQKKVKDYLLFLLFFSQKKSFIFQLDYYQNGNKTSNAKKVVIAGEI